MKRELVPTAISISGVLLAAVESQRQEVTEVTICRREERTDGGSEQQQEQQEEEDEAVGVTPSHTRTHARRQHATRSSQWSAGEATRYRPHSLYNYPQTEFHFITAEDYLQLSTILLESRQKPLLFYRSCSFILKTERVFIVSEKMNSKPRSLALTFVVKFFPESKSCIVN